LSSNPELKDKIVEARKTGFTDPCQPNKTTEDLIKDLLGDVNGIKGCPSANQFEAALAGMDKIRVSPNINSSCPMIDCIINNMLSNSELRTSFVDQLLKPCEGNSNINLSFTSLSFSDTNRDPNALASSEFTGNNKELVIILNTDKCNTSHPIDAFETIQHELIHNDIRRRLLEDYGFTVDPATSYQDALYRIVFKRVPTKHTIKCWI